MTARSALITGGQQGIGLGIARALKAGGFRLILAAEQPGDAPAVTAALRELGPGARYIRHDLADVAAVGALLDEAGPVDALIQNAGVAARQRGDMLAITPENFDAVMAVNLRGAFFLAQAVAKRMLDTPGGHYRSITFITSVSAEMASIERADYAMSKAGASMAARALALRLAPAGIGVFELRPGIIATGMTEGVKAQYDARIAAGLVPAGRWGLPEDIGRVILPLVRGDFAFATGAVFPVDGGLSVPRL